MGSLAPDSCHLTGSLWLHSVGRWEKSKVGQIPASRQDAIPSSWACVLAAVPPCPAPSQHGRICLHLIRRRQDSQGRTSECSDASAAVEELNFLISSIPLRCQESGPLQYSLFSLPTPLSTWLNSQASQELWGSSYHRSNHVYFLFEDLFWCSIAQGNYSLYPTAWKSCPVLLLCLTRGTKQINVLTGATLPCYSCPPLLNQHYDEVIFSMSKKSQALLSDYQTYSWLWRVMLECQWVSVWS